MLARPDPHPLGPRVLADVLERLLDDAQDDEVGVGGDLVDCRLDIDVDRDPEDPPDVMRGVDDRPGQIPGRSGSAGAVR